MVALAEIQPLNLCLHATSLLCIQTNNKPWNWRQRKAHIVVYLDLFTLTHYDQLFASEAGTASSFDWLRVDFNVIIVAIWRIKHGRYRSSTFKIESI